MRYFFIYCLILNFCRCSAPKELSFQCSEITNCEGFIWYKVKNEDARRFDFNFSEPNVINDFCRILKKSEKIPSISRPNSIYSIRMTINLADGSCRELAIEIITDNTALFTIMDKCEGNKLVQGRYSNVQLSYFFSEFFERNFIYLPQFE